MEAPPHSLWWRVYVFHRPQKSRKISRVLVQSTTQQPDLMMRKTDLLVHVAVAPVQTLPSAAVNIVPKMDE